MKQSCVFRGIDLSRNLDIKPLCCLVCLLSSISLWAFLCWCSGAAISGWTSLLIVICALGGLNLLCVGIVGLYLGKVLLKTKHRPYI